MGKIITPSSHPTSKKKGSKIKKDSINQYLRILSNNFGLINSGRLKRKREFRECPGTEHKSSKRARVSEDVPEDDPHLALEARTSSKFEYRSTVLQSKHELKDLFHLDELKHSMEYQFHTDWLFHVFDEISLEGLDGITIEALWSRMKIMLTHQVLLEGKEDILWAFIKHRKTVQYYILETPRGRLRIYDRNEVICPDTGIVLEQTENCEDIYPYSMVNHDGLKGSCSTYDSRLKNSDIIRSLSLKGVLDVYGNRLVMVGSQKMRENAIISEISNPNIDLVDNEYGLLERVGRSRKFGELTQGKVSILNLIKDSRSIFHIRKSLENKKLLKKQFFILRNLQQHQNKTGKLLHLPRFYRLQKSKTLMLIEEVVDLLRQKPGFNLEFGEFRKYFPRSTGIGKVIKSQDFRKHVQTNIFRPYRFVYPNAKKAEWFIKSSKKERTLRIFQLTDPTVNVGASWDAIENDQASDDDCMDDESPGKKTINAEFLKEVFMFIFHKGKEGVTLQEIEKNIEFDYYTIRVAIRKLQAKNVIDTVRSEQGKQRHIFYFARCFHSKISRPLSASMKLPENILHKILQTHKAPFTVTTLKQLPLTFNGEKVLRNLSSALPFSCKAFILAVADLRRIEEVEMDIDNPDIIKNTVSIALSSESVQTKIFRNATKREKIEYHFSNQETILVHYTNYDSTSKVILLKALLHGFKDKKLDSLVPSKGDESGNAAPDFETLTNDRKSIAFKISQSYDKDYVLGPTPLVLREKPISNSADVTILLSTPPKQYILDFTTYVNFDKNLTSLSLFRMNTILELINESKIICDIYKLHKKLVEIEANLEESKQTKGKIDKITLNRLLLKLSSEGYLKIFKYVMSDDRRTKVQWVVAHPSIELTNPILKTIQDQMEVKFFIGSDRPVQYTERIAQDDATLFPTIEIDNPLKDNLGVPTFELKKDRLIGKQLGFQPKFVRMQLLHELLFYLIYDYRPVEKLSYGDVEDILVNFSPEEYRDIPPIYRKSVDWKTFIPPLPFHKEWPRGWALLCDVILATPLSLWVKLFHISYQCQKLQEYMAHPIKKHYLVKDVPLEIRQVLMYQRKYLGNIIELVYKLCFIGLMQLGPQSSHFRDQVFLYLNKRTALLDTTTSSPSYHKISPKVYKEIPINFTSKREIEDYWCQLWTISMNTPLGQRTVMEGKSIIIEHSSFKPALMQTLQVKTPEQAELEDTGEIPGDRQGAAGLDSSMWAHIRRNWIFSPKDKVAKPSTPSSKVGEEKNIRFTNISKIKPITIKYRELMNQTRKTFIPKEHKKITTIKTAPAKSMPKTTRVVCRNFQIKKVNKVENSDLKDKAIMKRVGRTYRAIWNQDEDKILKMCKVALDLFVSKPVNEIIPLHVIRDVLHVLSPISKNKTTLACHRRVLSLRKKNPLIKRTRENISHLMNLVEISKYFSPIIYNLNKSPPRKHKYSSLELTVAYLNLVSYMVRNFSSIESILKGENVTMDYFASNNIQSFQLILVEEEKKKSNYINPTDESAVKTSVMESVLLSYLNEQQSGKRTPYQLYKICLKFPVNLIRSAVNMLKNRQALSHRKSKDSIAGIRAMPYQLSQLYWYIQKATYTTLTMHTIYQNYLDILGKTSKFDEVDPSRSIFSYARLLARNELAATYADIDYSFNVPDSAYILNPYIEDKTLISRELGLLYQRYLKQQILDRIKRQVLDQKCDTEASDNKELQGVSSEKKKGVDTMRMYVTRLLMSLPYLCNPTINKHFSPFMEVTQEDEARNYLIIFRDALFKIVMNLLNSSPEGERFLQNYIQKYRASRLIDTSLKEETAKVFKLVKLTREFLQTYELTNIKDCFERETIENNNALEETLKVWLDKSKMKSAKNMESNLTDSHEESQVHHCFFKYNKPRGENRNRHQFLVNTNLDEREEIPNLDDIIEGMMKRTDEKTERKIPHISELACLLSKEKFPELNKDETLLEELKGYFIVQYPMLEKFNVRDIDDLKSFLTKMEYFDPEKKKKFKAKIQRSHLIEEPNKKKAIKEVQDACGNCDVNLLDKILTFIYNKDVQGATGRQIKTTFIEKLSEAEIAIYLRILTDNFVIIRVGVAELAFVHHEFSSAWSVETFHLLPQENSMLHSTEKDQLQKLKQIIDLRIKSTKQFHVLLMPWVNIDSTLNLPLFEKWLNTVLSYCLDFPSSPLPKVFERFHLIKPVEIFFILETLQEMNCLKINVHERPTMSLFSERRKTYSRTATILDSFEDMYVEMNTLSTTCMGFYLDKVERE